MTAPVCKVDEKRPLTSIIRPGEAPPDLKAYEQSGGYQALRHALKHLACTEVTDLVKESNLRGRGGAGFPTGVKWALIPMGADAPKRKYVVANGDEMEPGTFKDRMLMEGNPHQLIEGMILAGYAIQADVGYIFLRGEYVEAARLLDKSLKEARTAGLVGENILGSGYNFELYVHTSAGRYICGEETALLNSLEGKRAIPRAKPPFPQIAGLFGKPTIVNNIETYCNIPHIIVNGAKWFHGLSRCRDGGTKIYGVSGKVKRPGCWELPMGIPIRELLEEHAGGMRDGLQLKCFLPGGASTDFLLPEHLDLAFDFDTIAHAGSRMGTGQITVVEEGVDMMGLLRNLMHFFAQESCGWCTPCRDGLPWTERLLEDIEAGRGRPQDIEVLKLHTRMLGPGRTFCAHAPGAMEPLQSALKFFPNEFTSRTAQKLSA